MHVHNYLHTYFAMCCINVFGFLESGSSKRSFSAPLFFRFHHRASKEWVDTSNESLHVNSMSVSDKWRWELDGYNSQDTLILFGEGAESSSFVEGGGHSSKYSFSSIIQE